MLGIVFGQFNVVQPLVDQQQQFVSVGVDHDFRNALASFAQAEFTLLVSLKVVNSEIGILIRVSLFGLVIQPVNMKKLSTRNYPHGKTQVVAPKKVNGSLLMAGETGQGVSTSGGQAHIGATRTEKYLLYGVDIDKIGASFLQGQLAIFEAVPVESQVPAREHVLAVGADGRQFMVDAIGEHKLTFFQVQQEDLSAPEKSCVALDNAHRKIGRRDCVGDGLWEGDSLLDLQPVRIHDPKLFFIGEGQKQSLGGQGHARRPAVGGQAALFHQSCEQNSLQKAVFVHEKKGLAVCRPEDFSKGRHRQVNSPDHERRGHDLLGFEVALDQLAAGQGDVGKLGQCRQQHFSLIGLQMGPLFPWPRAPNVKKECAGLVSWIKVILVSRANNKAIDAGFCRGMVDSNRRVVGIKAYHFMVGILQAQVRDEIAARQLQRIKSRRCHGKRVYFAKAPVDRLLKIGGKDRAAQKMIPRFPLGFEWVRDEFLAFFLFVLALVVLADFFLLLFGIFIIPLESLLVLALLIPFGSVEENKTENRTRQQDYAAAAQTED